MMPTAIQRPNKAIQREAVLRRAWLTEELTRLNRATSSATLRGIRRPKQWVRLSATMTTTPLCAAGAFHIQHRPQHTPPPDAAQCPRSIGAGRFLYRIISGISDSTPARDDGDEQHSHPELLELLEAMHIAAAAALRHLPSWSHAQAAAAEAALRSASPLMHTATQLLQALRTPPHVAAMPPPPPPLPRIDTCLHDRARRPRLFVYPESIGIPPWGLEHNARLSFLPERIRASGHYTSNGACADFYVMHNYVQPGASSARVLSTFDQIARAYPWWNLTRTATYPKARHLLISPCDHGPADCMYDREHRAYDWLDDRLGAIARWREVDYRSDKRRVAMLTLNGATAPNVNNFMRGVDIRLPAFDSHQCGALCGMAHHDLAKQAPRARAVLRRFSPWRGANTTRNAQPVLTARRRQLPPSLRTRRRFRLFFAGRSTKWGARGDLFRYHRNRSDFLLHDTSGRWPPANGANTTAHTFFAAAMRGSDFCLVPLGQSDGDSDRYLPALLYGCVPVFVTPGEVRPYEELLPWDDFSLRCTDVRTLPACLERVSAVKLLTLRRAMGGAWPKLLWTSLHVGDTAARLKTVTQRAGVSYLGEPPEGDAFSALIEVLGRRLGLR